MKKHLLLFLLAFGILSACGGGAESGDNSSAGDDPKAANTGDQPDNANTQPDEIYLTSFEQDGKVGFKSDYDDDAKVLIEPKFDYAGYVQRHGLTIVAYGKTDKPDVIPANGKFGFVNGQGEVVVEPKYDRAEQLYNGVAVVGMKREGDEVMMFGAVDSNGVEKVPTQYKEVKVDNAGSIAMFQTFEGKWGFLDLYSGTKVEPQYDDMYYLDESGYRTVFIGDRENLEGKYGFLNAQGEVAIPIEYDRVKDFTEGLAAVQNKKFKWGYINTSNELVIKYQFDSAEKFKDGKAKVRKKKKRFYIDKEGKDAGPVE